MAPPVGLEPTVRLRALPSLALASDNAPCCRLYASRPLCGFALQNPAQARRFIGVNNKKRTSFRCPSFCGSPSWTRTNDPAVNSRMLYRLSYRGISFSIVILVYPNENVNCFCGFFGEVAVFFIFFCVGRRI